MVKYTSFLLEIRSGSMTSCWPRSVRRRQLLRARAFMKTCPRQALTRACSAMFPGAS